MNESRAVNNEWLYPLVYNEWFRRLYIVYCARAQYYDECVCKKQLILSAKNLMLKFVKKSKFHERESVKFLIGGKPPLKPKKMYNFSFLRRLIYRIFRCFIYFITTI